MENWFGNIALIFVVTFKAIAVWLLVVAPLSLLLYFLLYSIFAKMPRFKEVSGTGSL
jgi:hypothetical protein